MELVGYEIVMLEIFSKSGPINLENVGLDKELIEDPNLEEVDQEFDEDEVSLKSNKRIKDTHPESMGPRGLGICQKEATKHSPNCGENKRRGQIPN